jgi:hypothetical protein
MSFIENDSKDNTQKACSYELEKLMHFSILLSQNMQFDNFLYFHSISSTNFKRSNRTMSITEWRQ